MNTKHADFIRLWCPVIVWMAAIMSVSSLPKNEIPQFSIPHIDKAAHAAEYLILGILAIRAMLGSSFSANITAITVCVIIFA